MVVKSRIWMFPGGLHRVQYMYLVLLTGLLIYRSEHGLAVDAQGPDFLDQKELSVKEIAENATLNNDDCGGLNLCSVACSRVTCYPLSGGFDTLQCINADANNEFSNTCPGACPNLMLADYSRSFVTLPAPGSTNLSIEVARDICLQRSLDFTFKNIAPSPSDYTGSAYFGSASGAYRAFPGREQNQIQCTSFDPRKMEWYLNGIISVSRDVKILVDVANSMGNPVPSDYERLPGTTYLDIVKDITRELLDTLSPLDFIEVLSFDSVGATSLGGTFRVNSSYDYFNPFGHAELAALVSDANKLVASPVMDAPSKLNGAILTAATSFNRLNTTLKVIIVLSDGLFDANYTTFPTSQLLENQAKLMVYKLPTNDDNGDPFLLNTPWLKDDICSVNGSFQRLDASETTNPLYSMRSYFTYLALTELTIIGDNVTWTISQDQNIITTTYPAFGSDELLIGLAGIDVFIDNLGEPLRSSVFIEVTRRIDESLLKPLYISSVPCYYQSSPTNLICLNSILPDSSTICPRTDYSSSLADRSCCHTCDFNIEAPSGAPSTTPSIAPSTTPSIAPADNPTGMKASKKWIPLEVAIPLVVLTILMVIGIFKKFRKTKVFLPIEKDLLDLNQCEQSVDIIEGFVNSSKRKSIQSLFNERQCLDLSSKLSKTTQNIREIVIHCRASNIVFFIPALKKLYQDLEKAKFLVNSCLCGEENWYKASISQIHNEIAFEEILLDVGFCYNAIYEEARSRSEDKDFPEDLRKKSTFKPASLDDVQEDQSDFRRKLLAKTNGHRASVKQEMKQCFARYLLAKLNHEFDQSEANTSIFWAKESEPPGTWGSDNCHFLGSGAQGGVISTKWMGIPCARKEFNSKEYEPYFLKEASILARLKHPRIVNFYCCGNSEEKGDRFIAMELMEKSLSKLIYDQGEVHFSPFVTIDIMIQIARGMCYLHSQGIAHRDLKPQNVVVNTFTSPDLVDYYILKLVDFGMAKIKVEASKSNTISIPGVGTTCYRAPEVLRSAHLKGTEKVNWFKVDVFSFAMTCGHVLCLKKPFGDTKLNDVCEDLTNGVRPKLPQDCPQELNVLLKECWHTNPQCRPSFEEICTRLETYRYRILRGVPKIEPNLQEKISEEFIEKKIMEHFKTNISIKVEDNPQVFLS